MTDSEKIGCAISLLDKAYTVLASANVRKSILDELDMLIGILEAEADNKDGYDGYCEE